MHMSFYMIILLGISLFSVNLFISYANKIDLLDNPNERSMHIKPTPKGAGIVFCLLFPLISLYLYFINLLDINVLFYVALTSSLLAIFGYFDDKNHLSAKLRFIFQIIISSLFIYGFGALESIDVGGLIIPLSILSIPVTVILVCWSINLFNFMDGIDGIACIEAIFVILTYGILFYLSRSEGYSSLCYLLVAMIGGLLYYNWPKAEVFMGSAGSYFLGFIVVILPIIGKLKYDIPLSCWFISYGLFLFDATITLVRRIINGERFYEAHRKHAYQRIVQAGLSVQSTLMAVILINISLMSLALYSYFNRENSMLALSTSIGMLASIYLLVEKIKKMPKHQ